MVVGPVELLVLGFKADGDDVARKVDQAINATPMLRDARRADDIRILDLLLLKKDAHGKIERFHPSDLTAQQRAYSGAAAAALIERDVSSNTGGLRDVLRNMIQGAIASAKGVAYDSSLYDSGVYDSGLNEVQLQEMTRHVPSNTIVAMVLLEHRWATSMMEAVKDVGGMLILDGLVTPATLSLFQAQLATAEAVANQLATAQRLSS
jgi:hypothetical protein